MTASIREPRSHLRLAVGVLLTFPLAACSASAGATGAPAGSTASRPTVRHARDRHGPVALRRTADTRALRDELDHGSGG